MHFTPHSRKATRFMRCTEKFKSLQYVQNKNIINLFLARPICWQCQAICPNNPTLHSPNANSGKKHSKQRKARLQLLLGTKHLKIGRLKNKQWHLSGTINTESYFSKAPKYRPDQQLGPHNVQKRREKVRQKRKRHTHGIFCPKVC